MFLLKHVHKRSEIGIYYLHQNVILYVCIDITFWDMIQCMQRSRNELLNDFSYFGGMGGVNPLLWPCLMKGSRGNYPRIDCYEQIMFSCTTEQRDGFDCTPVRLHWILCLAAKTPFLLNSGQTHIFHYLWLRRPRTIVS